MLRNKPLTSLQKSYDDCYLIYSTAVYFEAQGNEIDALRSWRSALDLIYYHNAYRVPSSYVPKSNAEKTLQNSLRDIEIRCKEKIYHLEALKQSRKDDPTEKCFQRSDKTHRKTSLEIKKSNTEEGNCGKMDRNNSPVVNAPDTMKPVPLLPHHLSPMRNGSVNSATASTKSPSGPTQNHRASCSNINTRKVSAKSDPTLKEIIKIPSSESRRKLKPTLRSSTRKGRIIPSRRGPKDENPVTSKAASLAWQSLGKSNKDFCRSNDDKGSTKIKVSSGQNNNRRSFHYESDSALHSQLKSKSQSLVDNNFIDQNPRSILTESFHAEGVSSLSHGPSFQTRISRQSDSLLQGLKDFYPLMSSCTKSSVPKSAESIPQLNQSLKSRNRKDLSHPVHSSTTRVKVEIPTRRKVKVEDCSESVQVISNKSNGRFPSKKASLLQSHELNQEKYDNLILYKEATQNDKVQTQYQRLKNVNHSDTTETTEIMKQKQKLKRKQKLNPITVRLSTSESNLSELQTYSAKSDWEAKVKNLMKSLPKGINQAAAKQVLDEVVVKGDEVHWDDIAGLDIAKNALKEAVVYPFLRPDLFKGLREPARGMLLFGPPGTGKTMLARAVATESNSTFFSISASSLTSKYMGESEKLVRALFQLAKLLAPSIIFVDEIDSLLSARSGSGEHESSRRIKTEFFIQWSDLQRAAAGRAQHVKESEQGDPSRVLVLAATNVPWIIDEAARRRFVRRQYIPLPEAKVRESQVRNLLSQQKHNLKEEDIHKLVDLTEGFSGSDITALAKDAAMGPLRSLGEAMLFMSMDEIRYINFADFEASLTSIRPSVSKESLEEFENWARVFGERGG